MLSHCTNTILLHLACHTHRLSLPLAEREQKEQTAGGADSNAEMTQCVISADKYVQLDGHRAADSLQASGVIVQSLWQDLGTLDLELQM